MPSDRNTAYPFLEQMRTEELEALLQQEFTAADGGEPDVDYIMAIMEVMKQRDANPPAAEADVDAAWRDFKENYQGQASAYETEVLPERDSSHLDLPFPQKEKPPDSAGSRHHGRVHCDSVRRCLRLWVRHPPGVRGLDRGDLWICDAGAGGSGSAAGSLPGVATCSSRGNGFAGRAELGA